MAKLTLVAVFGCAVALSAFGSGAHPIAAAPAVSCEVWEQRAVAACMSEDADALFVLIGQIPTECGGARSWALNCYKKYTAIIPASMSNQ